LAAQLFYLPYQAAVKPTNVGAPGAKYYFYSPGTTTLVPVYASSALTTQLSNPVIADGAGRTADIYLNGASTYKLIITDKNDAVLYSIDPFTPGVLSISGTISHSLTFNNSGSGAASGANFDGSADKTISANTFGLGTSDAPLFTAVNVGNTDTTITRAGAGDVAVEGNLIYRASGTDVPITDGGSGSSTAAGARTNFDVPSNADLAAAIASVTGGNSGGILPDGFVSGGNAIWTTGLAFKITAAQYRIAGTLYTSAEQTVTLAAADATNPRIDVLYLDTGGLADKITGTASANPSEPDVDPATQLEVTFVTVAALATAPTGATNESVYLEDTEWTTTVTGTHITKNSTNNPRTGSKDVEATSAVTGDSILFNKGSTVSASSYNALVFYIRNKTASWGTTRLRLHFQSSSGVRVGNIVTVQSGTFGFSTTNTSSYQAVSIPLTAFAIPAGGSIQKLNIAVTGSTAVGWYIDDMVLQLNGAGSGSTSGLTQTQADARYAQRSANLSDLGSATTALTNLGLSANGKSLVTAANYAAMKTLLGISSTGASAWNLQWGPLVNEAPTSNYATLDSRNGHPTLDFDTTTQEAAVFSGIIPADYTGAGITVSVYCALTSATSGTVGWLVSIERMDVSSLDTDADSFASAQTITATTVPGTSGQILKLSVNISSGANMDSLAAGEMFRIKIERDVTNDTAAGDAELMRVMMVSQ
jgi:hypothetical protein